MAAGPGANTQTISDIKPMLWFATDQDVIQLYNPLEEDFIGLVGQTKSVNTPFEIRKTQGAEASTADENGVRVNYGINLKNPDHSSVAQITTRITLPTKATTSLLGGVAKVVITQLVNEIMQSEGASLKMADPSARNEVEQRVIYKQTTIQQYLPDFKSEREQVSEAISNLNQPQTTETQAFPTETQQNIYAEPIKRAPGRPKRAE